MEHNLISALEKSDRLNPIRRRKRPFWADKHRGTIWKIILEIKHPAPAHSVIHPKSINDLLKYHVCRDAAKSGNRALRWTLRGGTLRCRRTLAAACRNHAQKNERDENLHLHPKRPNIQIHRVIYVRGVSSGAELMLLAPCFLSLQPLRNTCLSSANTRWSRKALGVSS